MQFSNVTLSILLAAVYSFKETVAFNSFLVRKPLSAIRTKEDTALQISVGLGPEAEEKKEVAQSNQEFVSQDEPDHELFRDSRLTDFDRQCDDWYGSLLGTGKPSFLGEVSKEAERRINTLPKLERNVRYPSLMFFNID
jgi:hypothetical protein